MKNRHFSKQCLAAIARSAAVLAIGATIACSASQTSTNSGTTSRPNNQASTTKPSSTTPADSGKAEELVKRAEIAVNRGQYSNARDLVAQALSADPKNKKAEALLERIAKAEGAKTQASRADDVNKLVSSGEKKLKGGDTSGASKDVTSALAIDPKSDAALKLRSQIAQTEADAKTDAAAKDVNKRIAAARDNIKRGNLPEASRNLASAKLAANGGFTSELASLEKDIKDAETRVAAEKNAREADEAIAQGRDQLKNQKFDLARSSANRALALDKSNKKATDLLSDISSAEASAAADKKQSEMTARLNSAKKLESAGDYDKAIAEYRSVLATDPNNRDARRGVETAETAMKAKADAAAKAKSDAEMAAAKADAEAAKAREVAQATPRAAAPAAAPQSTPAPARVIPTPQATPGPTPTPKPTAIPPPNFINSSSSTSAKTPDAKPTPSPKAPETDGESRKRAQRIFDDGMALYDQGKLSSARDRWREALKEDPDWKKPQSFLEETEAEYNALLAREENSRRFDEAEAAAQEKLQTLISTSTIEPKPLADFLGDLKILSGIDFVITGGVEARVEAAFEDKTLREVLDTVLLPIGLKWDREPGKDIVVVTPDLRTQIFPLTTDQLANVDTLLQNGTLGRLLYGPRGQRALDGQEVYADARQNVVVITDSPRNIDKFAQFIETLKTSSPQSLIFKSYSIQGDKAPQVKSLLSAVLSVDDKAPYNPERRLIVDGDTLIIKDTSENIAKAEQLLQDKNFLGKFYSDKLTVATFNLTPVIEFDENPDLARAFGEQIRNVVETLLYSQEGRTKAEREGRRLWWDPATLQLTVTDYPDNITSVQRFIEALPQIATKRRSKIYFLDWATAGDLSSQIQEFLGQAASTGSTNDGASMTRSVSRDDEFEFRDAVFRVSRIDENDVNDESDDEIELVARTGTTSTDVRIREFRSQFVEDYEIVADDISPSSTPGEGRARITVRFVPGGEGQAEETPTPAETATSDAAEGIQIVPVENLNALFVQYDTAEQIQELEFWIETLDIPTLQVSLEVRFVEVMESKARELKSDFVITDITQGFDFSEAVIGTRFAQDQDEFGNPFEVLPEDPSRANLPKGGLDIGMRWLNGGSPISLNLQALEAAGVINITNAPSATGLNGEAIDFTITRQLGLPQPTGTGSTGGTNNNNFSAVAEERPVEMTITPTITQIGNITMDIDVTIQDREANLGGRNIITNNTSAAIPGAVTVTNTQTFAILRKELTTLARIRDGGTVVLGGWINNRTDVQTSGVPVLRDIPFIGKLLFARDIKHDEKVTLNIFLSGEVLRD